MITQNRGKDFLRDVWRHSLHMSHIQATSCPRVTYKFQSDDIWKLAYFANKHHFPFWHSKPLKVTELIFRIPPEAGNSTIWDTLFSISQPPNMVTMRSNSCYYKNTDDNLSTINSGRYAQHVNAWQCHCCGNLFIRLMNCFSDQKIKYGGDEVNCEGRGGGVERVREAIR